MLMLFFLALFLSSALLFLIEPLFAKMLLPKFGGTPVVWNTCMVFFQAALLAGYAYAHLLTSRFKVRSQVLLHAVLLLTPLAVLPVVVPAGWIPAVQANPFWTLFGLLLITVGLPFFVVSTSGPLLQRWFSITGHRQSGDPYFLYAASNLGSMIGLLAYPVILEPWLPARQQSLWWTAGYGLLVLFVGACALIAWHGAKTRVVPASETLSTVQNPLYAEDRLPTASIRPGTLSWKRRFRWLLLAAVPSSMLLGLTLYLTTDIAAVPLLWVIPLAVYLLSFIVVFSRRPLIPHALALRAMPMLVLLLVILRVVQAGQPVWLVAPLHILAFFAVALVCHGELARDRPDPAHLTEFYLLISAGGVIGGLFNALAAPLLFHSVAEYPIAIVLACLLRPRPIGKNGTASAASRKTMALNLIFPILTGVLAFGLIWTCDVLRLSAGPLRSILITGLPALICFTFLDQPIRFGLGVGALLLASTFNQAGEGRLLYARRSFFGVHQVHRLVVQPANRPTSSPDDRTMAETYQFNVIFHGNTEHGRQWVDTVSGRPINAQEPLLYYHPHGPIGEVMQTLLGPFAPASHPDERTGSRAPGSTSRTGEARVALIGMGAGALAAYAQAGQHFTFFEIDPAVEDLAIHSGYFSYIPAARQRGAVVDVALGDARLTLENAPDKSFDLVVLDAFSSDAIPLHLLTREALALYERKLAPGGVLAWHISNKYLRLEPVVAALAADAGLAGWICYDTRTSDWPEDYARGRAPSVWVVLAKDEARVAELVRNPRWTRLHAPPRQAVWTDDFTNILSVFMWRGQDE